jgi:quinoprotein glucose dehydrogenase
VGSSRGATIAGAAAALGALAIALTSCASPPEDRSPSRDWSSYLGGLDSAQYSALAQVHRGNVHRLEVAWVHRTGDADPGDRSQIQCNPLAIDGVLFGTSAALATFALDAATGELLWRFDPFDGEYRLYGLGVSRGVAYWGGDARAGEASRIFTNAADSLWALDAATGEPVVGFGDGGRVDLRTGLGERSAELFVVANTPGVVYDAPDGRDLVVLGHRVAESLPAAPGDVRAFDARTGELVWSFRTVPAAGEAGAETWPEGARSWAGGANAWAGVSLDRERGLVFVPTGSAAYDFWGGNRPGANLYANSLVAVDARTGELRWHRQLVHHDLWDRDLPAPPNLVTLEMSGRRVDAVAQITKSAHVFVFDRATGEPLHPIEEVPVPASDLDDEAVWPTQPLPVRPPPFARQVLGEEQVTRRTPEARRAVLERLRRLRSGGQFVPPSREGTVVFPGFDGGGEWGGAAFDPETGLLYVNASEMAWVLTMVALPEGDAAASGDEGRVLYAGHCQLCHGVDGEGDPLGVHPPLGGAGERLGRGEMARLIRDGRGAMPSFGFLTEAETAALVAHLSGEPLPESGEGVAAPQARLDRGGGRARLAYTHTGYHRFLDPDGYPAVAPPWGTLTAIDLAAGEIRWQVPLGDDPHLEGVEGVEHPTGTENYGGAVVTAGGLVFIAATRDERIRAFDKATGEQLWEAPLPAAGYATPAVYAVNGRQYVVVAAGGGKIGSPSGDAYVAFALPEGE